MVSCAKAGGATRKTLAVDFKFLKNWYSKDASRDAAGLGTLVGERRMRSEYPRLRSVGMPRSTGGED
eukprot:6190904-Alexandrium_andersonii.AAC.1